MIRRILRDGRCPVLISQSNGLSASGNIMIRNPRRDNHFVRVVLSALGHASQGIFVVSDLDPKDMWSLIGEVDFLFARRIHAVAGAVAKGVGVQFIKYANEPEARKFQGFDEIFNQRALLSIEDSAGLDSSSLAATSGGGSIRSPKLEDAEALKNESQDQFDLLASFA